jgi:beta-aspartyl-peptidase (threonine type)
VQQPAPEPVDFAIAIHGGAGAIGPKPPGEEQAYRNSLEETLAYGRDLLDSGEKALDVVEKVIIRLEDDPLFNAGKGAVYNHDGNHELDASIMDGYDLSCGGVAGVKTVANPITLARMVMDLTPHVLLAGPGADAFAGEMGVDPVPQEYFHTERGHQRWQKHLKELEEERHGTVGAVVLDRYGNLAAGTSTGGLTGKRFGRVGDSPVIGAGTYADNGSCAVSCTGQGEEFIRLAIAYNVSNRMKLTGATLLQAADDAINRQLQPDTGGLIAVDAQGNLVVIFNTSGMYRGMADSNGLFEVGIYRE